MSYVQARKASQYRLQCVNSLRFRFASPASRAGLAGVYCPRNGIPRARWEEFNQLLRNILQVFPDAWEAFQSAVRAAAKPRLYGPRAL